MKFLKNTIVQGHGFEIVLTSSWNDEVTITYEEYTFPSWEIYSDEYNDPDNWVVKEILRIKNKALAQRAFNCSSFKELQALIKKELNIDLLEEAHL